MDKKELINIHDNIKNEYLQNLNRYLTIMQDKFPIYIEPIDKRKRRDKIKFIEQEMIDGKISEEDANDLFELLYDDQYKINYNDPLNSEEYCNISHLFFPYLYNNKEGLNELDIQFIKYFINIVNNGRLLQDILYGENPYRILNYIDSDILHFDNEDIIITDPCYFVKNEDNIDEVMKYIKMVYQSTLYGDWSCTVYNNENILGTFCADAGLVSVASLKDVLEYNPEFDYHINRKWTTALIPNFTGNVTIKVVYNNEFYCYVEGKGNINFIGRQTGL